MVMTASDSAALRARNLRHRENLRVRRAFGWPRRGRAVQMAKSTILVKKHHWEIIFETAAAPFGPCSE